MILKTGLSVSFPSEYVCYKFLFFFSFHFFFLFAFFKKRFISYIYVPVSVHVHRVYIDVLIGLEKDIDSPPGTGATGGLSHPEWVLGSGN